MSRSQEVAVFTFGQTPTYQSDENFDLSVSDDNRALTLRFPEFEVTAGAGKSQAPTSTRAFCLVLPLEGDDETAEIEFIATNAFVATTDGATATMVLSANGQTTFADFPANTDQSFDKRLKFTAPSPSECRLCVLLLVGRDSDNPNAEAFLSVPVIDAEILPRRR
jgi:hypothetical protein